jgi:hypothetical protein
MGDKHTDFLLGKSSRGYAVDKYVVVVYVNIWLYVYTRISWT